MVNYTRYFFLFLVVFLHSILIVALGYCNNAFSREYGSILLNNMHPVSVLALISGYLYFANYKMTTLGAFFKTGIYQKRLKRLIVPYLSWKILIFGTFLLLFCIYNIAAHRGMQLGAIADYLRRFVKCVFCSDNERWTAEYLAFSPHLWYIHHLIIMFLIMPVLMHYKVFQFTLPVLALIVYIIFPQMELILHFRFVLFCLIGCVLGIYKDFARSLFYFLINIYTIIGLLIFFIGLSLLAKYYFHIDPSTIGFGVTSEFTDIPNTAYSLVVPAMAFLIVQCALHHLGIKHDMHYDKGKHYMLYILHFYLILFMAQLIFKVPMAWSLRNRAFFVIPTTFAVAFLTVWFNSLLVLLLEKKAPKLQRYLV